MVEGGTISQQQPPQLWHFAQKSTLRIQTSSLRCSTSSCKLQEFFHVTSAFVLWPRPWRVALQNPTACKFLRPHGCHRISDWCVRVCMCELIEGEKGRKREGGGVCGHIPSLLATAFITLLSQLQTKPQCGGSFLKSQHDKNSLTKAAQPTLPWHMGYFLLSLVCLVDWDCDRTLRLSQSLPKHITSCPITPMIWCPGTQTVMSYGDTRGRVETHLALASASPS